MRKPNIWTHIKDLERDKQPQQGSQAGKSKASPGVESLSFGSVEPASGVWWAPGCGVAGAWPVGDLVSKEWGTGDSSCKGVSEWEEFVLLLSGFWERWYLCITGKGSMKGRNTGAVSAHGRDGNWRPVLFGGQRKLSMFRAIDVVNSKYFYFFQYWTNTILVVESVDS